MSFESDFFKKKRVRFETLSAFGFVKIGQDYLYKEIFMAGDFEAQVKISESGQVSGRVLVGIQMMIILYCVSKDR